MTNLGDERVNGRVTLRLAGLCRVTAFATRRDPRTNTSGLLCRGPALARNAYSPTPVVQMLIRRLRVAPAGHDGAALDLADIRRRVPGQAGRPLLRAVRDLSPYVRKEEAGGNASRTPYGLHGI